MKKSDLAREKHHANLRSLETEVHNTLGGINTIVDRVSRGLKVRDLSTARTNFQQVQIAMKAINTKMQKVAILHKKLKIAPGPMEHELQTSPRSVDVHTAPRKAAAKPEKKEPAKPAPKKVPAKKGKAK